MPKTKQITTVWTHDGATICYATRLWHLANVLCGRMKTAEYTCAGLSFLSCTFISDTCAATDGCLVGCFGGTTCE
jgi:hypothetical protein